MSDQIIGWRELERFSHLKEHKLRTVIARFGFPKPWIQTKIQLNGRRGRSNTWKKQEVMEWIVRTQLEKPEVYERFYGNKMLRGTNFKYVILDEMPDENAP